MLAHILEKQNATLDVGHVGRSDQGGDHGEVSAPQDTTAIHRIRIRRFKTQNLKLATHHFGKDIHGESVRLARAKIKTQRGTGIADHPGLGQQRQVEGGEVTLANESLSGSSNRLPVQMRQQSGDTISPTRGHDDRQLLLDRALKASQPLRIRTRKALMFVQGCPIHRYLETHALQTLAAPLSGQHIPHCARG